MKKYVPVDRNIKIERSLFGNYVKISLQEYKNNSVTYKFMAIKMNGPLLV